MALLPFAAHAAGSSYKIDASRAEFISGNGSVLELKLCSSSVVRVRFAPDGKLQEHRSFAVVNEDLEDLDMSVSEQEACYEIFTDKLRIRIDKEPLSLKIYDKYQKLLFSDCADRGRAVDGTRKIEYKILRRDEHFFGLGEKTGKLDRRGEQ